MKGSSPETTEENPRHSYTKLSRYSDYGLEDRGDAVRFPIQERDTSFFHRGPNRLCGPASLLYNGHEGCLPRGVEGQGREDDLLTSI
jgi:hypothetical protein